MLNDGREITDPMDLLPVVAPDSWTAQYARRYQARANQGRPWMGITVLAIGASLASSVVTLIWGATSSQRSPSLLIGIDVVGFGIALLSFIIGRVVEGNSEVERLAAFRYYGRDLRAFLFREPAEAGAP